MIKSKKITAVAVLVVCVFGTFYFHSKVEQRMKNFSSTIDNFSNVLPEGLSQEHIQNVGLFSTNGEYILFEESIDLKSKNPIGLIKYKLNHGLSTFFASAYDVTMDFDFNTSRFPNLSNENENLPFLTSNGKYYKNGNFEFNGNAQDLIWKLDDTGTELKIEGNTMNFVYDKKKSEYKLSHKISKISDKDEGSEFNNLDMIYTYNMFDSYNTKFDVSYSIDSINQGYAKFKDLNFNMNLHENGNYLNSGLKIKVDSITSVLSGDKNFSFDMDMSVVDLDSGFYKKVISLGEQDYISVKDKQETLRLFHRMIDSGFILNIGKFNINASEDIFKSTFKVEFKKLLNQESFVDRSKIRAEIYLKSPFVSSSLNVIPTELRDLMTGKVNEIKIDFQYDAGKVNLNGSEIDEGYGELITERINDFEEEVKNLKNLDLSPMKV